MSSLLAAQRTEHDVSQPGQAVTLSHPDHLAAIAMLFGMTPKAVRDCRVLELGCGAGLNLLPMADRHPQSTYVGLDRSPEALAMATQLARVADLSNVEFRELRLDAGNEGLGTFDYIICDDVYSLMPLELQASLLAFCRARLNPQGVLYLSYRALPGWIVPGVVRDLARAASQEQEPLPARVATVRRAMQFIADALPADAQGWGRLLRGEATLAQGMSDVAVVHEYLGAQSHPVYFHEMAARADAQRLQYLGDADVRTMFAGPLGPTVESKLAGVARDTVSLESRWTCCAIAVYTAVCFAIREYAARIGGHPRPCVDSILLPGSNRWKLRSIGRRKGRLVSLRPTDECWERRCRQPKWPSICWPAPGLARWRSKYWSRRSATAWQPRLRSRRSIKPSATNCQERSSSAS